MRSLAVAALAILPLACAAGIPPVTYSIMPAVLAPIDAEHNRSHDFARTFCSVLTHVKDANGHSWGDCSKYIESAESAQPQSEFSARYRFLLVAGFGAECLKDVRAFSTSIAHLKEAHQVEVEYFPVAPFGSSEENGKSIARQIEAGSNADPSRRYVLVGYDKGAADLLDALRVLDSPRTRVAAVVSVAGIVGGLWQPESKRALMDTSQPWIAPGCPGNIDDGMHSLLREVRLQFLRQNPIPVTTYSVVAASSFDETSSLLRRSWKSLSVHAREQDGEMIAWESVIPGSRYLGTARADHWAVALPFEELPRPPKSIDRNHFPRDALLEAIVRYVTADAGGAPPTREVVP